MLRSAAKRRVSKHATGLLALLFLSLLAQPTLAQTVPPLTGRVVDAANVLKPGERAALEAKLKAHEERTSDQVVVATVASLGGVPVEDYANRLYRAWALGTKEKSNGALLLVAPADRKVRIEVGYGLEGALTDALASVIVRTAIAPRFKTGDFAGGIDAGVTAMLSILSGDAEEWQRRPKIRSDEAGRLDWVTLLILLVVIVFVVRAFASGTQGASRSHRRRGGGWIVPSGSGWGGGGGWSSGGGFSGGGGGFSGGGFSGGGGSSGGGGASGSW